MKLKEKLAIDYMACRQDFKGVSHREIEIYLSGFDKALDMAKEKILTILLPLVIKSEPLDLVEIAKAVLDIGEEEGQ